MESSARLKVGEFARRGETLAALYLESKGYIVIDRNRRFRSGEIDIICRKGDCTVFVEVKTRSGPHFTPCESVDGRKQRRLQKLALQWLAERRELQSRCRFDVVAVYMRRDPPYQARVEHIERAF